MSGCEPGLHASEYGACRWSSSHSGPQH